MIALSPAPGAAVSAYPLVRIKGMTKAFGGIRALRGVSHTFALMPPCAAGTAAELVAAAVHEGLVSVRTARPGPSP